jgi:hypothetical protein
MKESRRLNRFAVIVPMSLLSASLALGVQAQSYSSLSPLPGGMQGAPILVSNNPESVSRAGLLLGMDAMNSFDPGKVTRRLTGASTLDSVNCPSGGLREFSFYMHHLFGDPSGTDARVDRVFLILEPVGASATFTAYGAAISQRDIMVESPNYTLDPGRSPSYSVARVLTTGSMPSWVGSTHGSKIINFPTSAPRTITGPTEIFQLRGGTTPKGASTDARITFKASSGCLRARLVAAPSTITTATAANDLGKSLYAWGNVASTYNANGTTNIFGGTPCTNRQSQNSDGTYNWSGWGRPAGIYQYNKWAGTVPVAFTATGQTFGYRYLAAPANLLRANSTNPVTMPPGLCDPPVGSPSSPSGDAQRPLALRYYSSNTSPFASGVPADRDSDKFSTANYGAEYNVTYNVTNNSTLCMKVELVFTAYPGGQVCAAYTGDPKTRHYDGDFKITTTFPTGSLTGITSEVNRAYIKCNASVNTTPYIPAGAITEKVLAQKVLGTASSNRTVTWAAQNFIPGLISIPAAMIVRSTPSTCP